MTMIDRKRLIADTGKLLMKGTIKAKVVDISSDDTENWIEIDDPNFVSHNQSGGGAE